jgi:hypothetical protein
MLTFHSISYAFIVECKVILHHNHKANFWCICLCYYVIIFVYLLKCLLYWLEIYQSQNLISAFCWFCNYVDITYFLKISILINNSFWKKGVGLKNKKNEIERKKGYKILIKKY